MNKIVDERVVQTKRRIQSNGYLILQVLLLLSMLVQRYYFKLPLSHYLGELICIFLVGAYTDIAIIREGVFSAPKYNKVTKEGLKTAGVVAVLIIAVRVLLEGDRNIVHIGVAGLLIWLFIMLTRAVFTSLSERRQELLDEELMREEENEDEKNA